MLDDFGEPWRSEGGGQGSFDKCSEELEAGAVELVCVIQNRSFFFFTICPTGLKPWAVAPHWFGVQPRGTK